MEDHNEIREFLITRRARLTPEQVGLPDFGGRRRVAGLRREEVALIAGMSVEYYTRLERGNATGVSEAVLEGISRALLLDEAEHRHLYDLIKTANDGAHPVKKRTQPRAEQVRPSVQQTLDAMKDVPTIVQNGRLDIVTTNRLGAALFSEMQLQPGHTANFARFIFLDPAAQPFYRNWEDAAAQTVALLRAEAGRSPYDKAFADLVGELTTKSTLFGKLWAAHNVREHRTGIKSIHHPIVGDLDLTYEAMDISSVRGLQMIAYTAEHGSASYDGIQLLANLVATSPSPLLPKKEEAP